MARSQNERIAVGCDLRITLEWHGAHVTSGAGLLAYRELDDDPVAHRPIACQSGVRH